MCRKVTEVCCPGSDGCMPGVTNGGGQSGSTISHSHNHPSERGARANRSFNLLVIRSYITYQKHRSLDSCI